MENELKPCPFCGKVDSVYFVGARRQGGYANAPRVGCRNCNYEIPGVIIYCSENTNKQDVTEMNDLLRDFWNKRAEIK